MDKKMIFKKQIIADLDADIIPEKSAAGLQLGLSFKKFLKYAPHKIVNEKEYYKDYYSDYSTNGFWLVCHFQGTDPTFGSYDRYAARWNSDVTLCFDGKPKKVLESIAVKINYRGALFNKLRIGDRLDKMLDEYDLDFYADSQWLDYRDNSGDCVPIEIKTNYFSSYEEDPDQMVEQMIISMDKEEGKKYGIEYY